MPNPMNKVISIHLRGHAYQLEEPGYNRLRAYLDEAASRLASDPDRAEIIDDLEEVPEPLEGHTVDGARPRPGPSEQVSPCRAGGRRFRL